MNRDQFNNEKKYLATMIIARNLYKQGLISEEEYCHIDTKYKGKYKVSLSTLFTDIDLIKLGNYGNM